MSATVTFHFKAHLIWYSIDPSWKPGVHEITQEMDSVLIVDSLVQIPFIPYNPVDFTAEFRLESLGYYTRIFETARDRISYSIQDENLEFIP